MSLLEEHRRKYGTQNNPGAARAAPLDDPNRGAGFWPRWSASWYDDPQRRAEVFADYRPGADYRVTDEGIAYRPQGEQDFYLEEPSGFASGALGTVADMTGGGVPTEVGALLGSFLGPLGAVAGAGLGEAGMQMWQAAQDEVGGTERRLGPAAAQTALAAGAAGLGEGLGAVGRQFMRRGPNYNFDTRAADELASISREFGVPLTPGEVSGNRELLALQSLLHDSGRTGDVVDDFLQKRQEKIEAALESYLDELSQYKSAWRADMVGGNAAGRMRQAMVDERRADASPLYEAAAEDQADVLPVIESLQRKIGNYPQSSRTARVLQRAQRLLLEDQGEEVVPLNRVGTLHSAKTELDDMIEAAQRRGDNNLARELTDVQEQLLQRLDEGSDAYRQAREQYALSSQPINDFDATIVGSAVPTSDGFVEHPAMRLGQKLFGKHSSPYEIQYAKDVLTEQNPEAWDAVVRSYLQRTFDEITDNLSTTVTNVGGQFRKQVFGNPRMRAQMKIALGPEKYARFEKLMKVMEATGLGLKGQSMTEPRQQFRQGIERQATPIFNKFTSPYDWLTGQLKEKRLDDIYRSLVKIVTADSTGVDFSIDRAIKAIERYQGYETPERVAALQGVVNMLLVGMSQ